MMHLLTWSPRRPSRWLLGAALYLVMALPALRAAEIEGLVLPVEDTSVSSPVLQEVIEAVLVKEGDQVKKGDVLVQLRSAKEQLQVDEAKKLVEQAQFVQKGLDALYKEKIGSHEQAIKAQTELDLAKIRLALAEEQLREKTVRSPVDGIVTRKFKEAGESVDRVEKLAEIVNIDRVYVRFYLDPKFMEVLHNGDDVNVRFPVLAGQQFKGKIDFIAPQIDASSNLFIVKLLIDNPGHKIKAGMRGLADFTKAAGA